MPVAYTPGLRIAADTIVRRTRRLPMRGEVMVKPGDIIGAETVVARAQLPGDMSVLRAAQMLHVEPHELDQYLVKRPGDQVQPGDVVARTQGMWGLFKSEVRAPITGTIEEISATSGYVRLRERPKDIDVLAHIAGRVIEVIESEGAVVEARGALVQGIFGVGGERRGRIRVATEGLDQPLRADRIPDCAGCVLIAGAGADGAAIARAAEAGATGLVVGAVNDESLRQYVGYDIGVAITGHEAVPMTLILTEGFGELPMAKRTWDLLSSLQGELASIDGATQIRAGVIRPEIIVTHQAASQTPPDAPPAQILETGARVRVIREPHFGALGRVSSLPSDLTEVETESKVRIAMVKLDRGGEVRVPRANLELIQQ